jgi:hypothetical protein
MIPEPEVELTPEQVVRAKFTRLAAALVLDGVSPDLVMLDAREGCALAQDAGRLRKRRGSHR